VKKSAYLIRAIGEIGTTSEEIHSRIDHVQHSMYALQDLASVQSSLEQLSQSDQPILQEYYKTILDQFEKVSHSKQSYEHQKSFLQEIRLQDNHIIEHHKLSPDNITLLSSINHAFTQTCKNIMIARDLG
jgi:dihydroxyacetone kinase DhaKLM complex PTS-EIIA-like component DhaM